MNYFTYFRILTVKRFENNRVTMVVFYCFLNWKKQTKTNRSTERHRKKKTGGATKARNLGVEIDSSDMQKSFVQQNRIHVLWMSVAGLGKSRAALKSKHALDFQTLGSVSSRPNLSRMRFDDHVPNLILIPWK